MLEIKNLTIKRGDKTVIEHFSLSMRSGECIVISGPNGSGKSTLAQAMAGMEGVRVAQGLIELGGEDITVLLPEERFARGVFLIHQDPPELPGVTFETVARAMLITRSGRQASRTRESGQLFADMREALKTVGLSDVFIDKPMFVGCSGGEKKRLELALLLLACPKLAILDELDSGLDEAARGTALEVIERLRERGAMLIVITHHEGFAAGLQGAQRVPFALSM